MAKVVNSTALVAINDSSRALFKLMNFHEIPEDADFVAFLEDGDAAFIGREQLIDSGISPFDLLGSLHLIRTVEIALPIEF